MKCPNKNSKEWITLKEALGINEAYRVFIANNEEVPSMIEVEFIIDNYNKVPVNQKEVDILNKFNSNAKELLSGKLDNISQEFGDSLYDLFTDEILEELTDNNINKDNFTKEFNKELVKNKNSNWFIKAWNYIKELFLTNSIKKLAKKIKTKDKTVFNDVGQMSIYGITTNQGKNKIPIINKLLHRTITPVSYHKKEIFKHIPVNLFKQRDYNSFKSFLKSIVKDKNRLSELEVFTETQYKRREDAWRLSNGLAQIHNTFKYKGRGIKNKDNTITYDKNGNDIYEFVNPLFSQTTINQILKDKNLIGKDTLNYVMGFYNNIIGQNEIGYFLEYSDVWDINIDDIKKRKSGDIFYQENVKSYIKNKIIQKVINKTQTPFVVTGKMYKSLNYNEKGEEVIYYTQDITDNNIEIYNNSIYAINLIEQQEINEQQLEEMYISKQAGEKAKDSNKKC
jgi:hypothetical protein